MIWSKNKIVCAFLNMILPFSSKEVVEGGGLLQACNMHAPGMRVACTWHAPGLRLA